MHGVRIMHCDMHCGQLHRREFPSDYLDVTKRQRQRSLAKSEEMHDVWQVHVSMQPWHQHKKYITLNNKNL